MFRFLLRTALAFVIGILSLLGAHRLYLQWRNSDLDVEREIRQAVRDLRQEAEARLNKPVGRNVSDSRVSRRPAAAKRDVEGKKPDTRESSETGTPRVQTALSDILARLSSARKTCNQEIKE